MKPYSLSLLIIFIILFDNYTITQEQTVKENPFSQSKFVPDISFIIDASYLYHNIKNHEFEELQIPGISSLHSNATETHNHTHITNQKGFNLNYGELYISATADPFFDLTGILHLSKSGLEIEEGYFVTRKLPLGFQLKGGKFYSGFGKINEQHPHIWDFVEQPLIFNSFFGSEGLNETGVQLNWIAPTKFFLSTGVEVFQGENEPSFGTQGFSIGSNEIEAIEHPNLLTGFISTSLDIDDFTGLLKFSIASGKKREVHTHYSETEHEENAISAKTNIFGISITGKYLIDPIKSLSFQTEYLYRTVKGNKYSYDSTAATVYDLERNQSGLYSQIVYKFAKRWRFGARYEFLENNFLRLNNISEKLPSYLPRYSAMIDFNPTEFSRIRFQYTYDRSRYLLEDLNYSIKAIHQITLQINLSIGAHGAHPF
ncbi:MAG: Zinc-regulated TonB-dependent outer membrane receptor [Ignavibacteriae bacterium]|nr:MAG: Zinc-regulated TonB-dependent outer membrane receptor [Ignavibacteriota bacterium]